MNSEKLRKKKGIMAFFLAFLLLLSPYVVGHIEKVFVEKILARVSLGLSGAGRSTYTYDLGFFSSKISIKFESFQWPSKVLEGEVLLSHLKGSGEVFLKDMPEVFQASGLKIVFRAVPFYGMGLDLSANSLMLNNTSLKVLFAPFQSRFYVDQTLMLRYADIFLQGLHLQPTDSTPASLWEGARVTWNLDGDINHGQGQLQLALLSFKEGEKVLYGPGKAHMLLSNLDFEALSALKDGVMALKSQGLGGMGGGASLLEVVPRFLEKNPDLEIKECFLRSFQGNISCYGKMAFTSAGGDTSILGVFNNLKILLDFKAPKDVFKMIIKRWLVMREIQDVQKNNTAGNLKDPLTLQKTMALSEEKALTAVDNTMVDFFSKKYIIEEEEGVGFHFKLQNGSFLINGNPFIPTL